MGGGDQQSVPTPSAYDDGIYRPAAMVYELHVLIPPHPKIKTRLLLSLVGYLM